MSLPESWHNTLDSLPVSYARINTAVQAADITRYFEQYGWTAAQPDVNHWQATFVGDQATFTVDVRLTPDWLLFAIDLSALGSLDSPDRARSLLVGNAQMLMAKFAIEPGGKLLLRIDMPTQGFTYSHFVDCLGALSHYADLFRSEWA